MTSELAPNASGLPTNKQDFFAAQINPTKPPLLPPSVVQKMIVPVSTAIFVALVLSSINPPFIQKRMKTKNRPSGQISWTMLLCVSLVAGGLAYVLPWITKYVSG